MPNYSFLPTSQTGYGSWPGSAAGTPNPTTDLRQLPSDQVTFNAGLGGYVNMRTRKPWTGKLQDGTYVHQGKKATDPTVAGAAAIDPNNVAQRFQAVDVPKDPAVSSATDDLLTAFKKGAADSLKGFDDYIKQFKDAASGAQAASKAATDQADKTAATMEAAQKQYGNALDTSRADYAALNAQDAAAQRAIVQQNQDLLPMYDAAGNAIGDRQMQEVVKNLSRYKLGTGTPTSLGSDESRILAQGVADVMLPLKQAQIGRRYDILNNLALPVQRDITGRETARIAQFNPAMAGQQYTSTQQTASAVQALKDAVAKQDWATALQIMQVPEISAHVQQQIMAGDTSLLGAISQLRESSHYRGLQDKLGVNLSQPQYFSPGDMTYPAPSRYPTQPALGPNAPVQVGPTGKTTDATTTTGTTPSNMPGGASQADYAYYLQTGKWPQTDPNFSEEAYQSILSQFENAGGSRYASKPTQFVADPTVEGSGYRDRYTGLPVENPYSYGGNVDYSTGE